VTQYLWDTSHYDGELSVATLRTAHAQGIVALTHKVGEGTGGDDPLDGPVLANARDAGIPLLGGYHVVRSGEVGPQVDALIALADRDEPWWRSWPGWFWQADLERWSYDQVPAATGIEFAQELRRRTGKVVALYASRSQYGDQLRTWDGPLWNAHYVRAAGDFRAIYPGDQWRPTMVGGSRGGWAAYSGREPDFLQYSSLATIAGVTTSDSSAYRGTLEELTALLTGGDIMPDPALADILSILTAMAHGLDQATVHDRDGVLSLKPYWARIAAEVAQTGPPPVVDLVALVAAVRGALADPAVTAALAKAVNDDAAKRLAQ
jgi:GH25 family lysozyme M1 (1,4-beta-N-acetylmuramidase)